MTTSLIDLRHLHSDAMHWELHQLVCDTRDGDEPVVERVIVSAEGYGPSGEYVGAMQPGERMYRVDTMHYSRLVRTKATVRQLCSALAQ